MSTIRVVNLQHTDATVPNIVLESDGTSVFASGITISGATTLTVSGTAEFASGTAAAPKITFIDDNDTGIYSPAANNVGITTNGTAALTIDASQQVGIGTAFPVAKLDVRGNIYTGDKIGINTTSPNNKIHAHASSAGPAYFQSTNDSSGSGASDGIVMGLGSAADAYYWNYENGAQVWATNASERMRIASSGKS